MIYGEIRTLPFLPRLWCLPLPSGLVLFIVVDSFRGILCPKRCTHDVGGSHFHGKCKWFSRRDVERKNVWSLSGEGLVGNVTVRCCFVFVFIKQNSPLLVGFFLVVSVSFLTKDITTHIPLPYIHFARRKDEMRKRIPINPVSHKGSIEAKLHLLQLKGLTLSFPRSRLVSLSLALRTPRGV